MPTEAPRVPDRHDCSGVDHTDCSGVDHADASNGRCRTVVEPQGDGSELCTIYSTHPDDVLTATWLSAATGSFRSLEECR